MKKPTSELIYKCLEIRRKNKRIIGSSSDAELKLCQQIFKKYKEWYGKTERIIFIDTLPFGADYGQYEKERAELEKELL